MTEPNYKRISTERFLLGLLRGHTADQKIRVECTECGGVHYFLVEPPTVGHRALAKSTGPA